MAPLWQLSAIDQAEGIATGRFTSSEVMNSVFDRIEDADREINAVVEINKDAALDSAAQADEALVRGNNLGPLHGVPITVKVNVDVSGLSNNNGVPAFRDMVSSENSPVVQNLLNAGALILGRTNTPEFSMRGTTDNPLYGLTRNPWNLVMSPGGSSGGSGVALATGSCTIASGSDIGGSIRIPAAACGVFGYKPPYGRNPEVPYGNLDYYSHSGPMARSVDDIILMQSLTAGLNNQDIASLPKPSNFDGNFDLQNI